MSKRLASLLLTTFLFACSGSSTNYAYQERAVVVLELGGYGDDATGGATGTMIGDGLILTARHVAHSATKLYVTARDGQKFIAKPVWLSDKEDVAVLRSEDEPVGEPQDTSLAAETLKVGDPVFFIGHPHLDPRWVYSWGKVAMSVPLPLPDELADDPDVLPGLKFTYTTADAIPGESGAAIIGPDGKIVGVLSLGVFRKMAYTALTNEDLAAIAKLRSGANETPNG